MKYDKGPRQRLPSPALALGHRGIIAAIIAGIAAAGCTQQPGHPATTSPSTAGRPPGSAHAVTCQQIVTGTRQLTLRRIVRRSPFTPSFTWPALLRSHNAASAQAVAQALCALPQPPPGVSAAAPGYLVTYQLTLLSTHGFLAAVTFLPHASNEVTGLPGQSARLYSTHATLWPLLGAAVGLPHATLATFAGNPPKTSASSGT